MGRQVFQLGAEVLRRKGDIVKLPLDGVSQTVIADLVESMRDASLVGMAAPQLGHSLRIFVTEVRPTKNRNWAPDRLRVFINPEILVYSAEKEVGYEGCGSVAEAQLFGEVERAKIVEVRYHDEAGVLQQDKFEGFLARVVQHEFDHLEGVVFTDRLYTVTTLMSGSEFRKMREAQAGKV